MRFERVSLADAKGRILGHNVTGADGRRVLRKGRPLSADDVDTLRALGQLEPYVALLDDNDVPENEAATRVARASAGPGLRRSPAKTGRVNLFAEELGVLRIDLDGLARLNRVTGVTLATLPRATAVAAGRMVATIKIIPYALPEEGVAEAEAVAGPVLELTPLAHRRAGLVLFGSRGARRRIEQGYRPAVEGRLTALGASLEGEEYVDVDTPGGEERLAAAVGRLLAEVELLILGGETAIQDRHDLAPRALEAAGAEVELFGAPVDPGNLLLLAYRGDVPILGAPGCVRSPKTNVVDLVLPRLLAGDRVTAQEILSLAHGGLLEDVPERPLPRSWLR